MSRFLWFSVYLYFFDFPLTKRGLYCD